MVTPTTKIAEALEAHGCGPPRAGNWRCPAHNDRTPSLSLKEGDDGRALLKCHADCETRDILEAIGLDWSDVFDGKDAKRERTRSKARPKAASATQSTKREPRHEVEVIGPPTAAQVATMIHERRITSAETLARVGAQHVRARFRDEGSGEWKRWGEYLGLPALGSTWMLYGIRGDGGEWLDDNGKLRRFMAGPCSLVVSPDLRERNGARVERVYDFEGAPDLLAWIDAGGVAGIASTGGAGALGGHDANAATLLALEAAEVVVLRDLDDAGRKGATKAADWYLHRGVAVRVPTLPDALGAGGDVRDFLMGRKGGESLGGIADLDALASAAELRTPGGDEEPSARSNYLELAPTREELQAMAAAPPIVPVATHLLYPSMTTVFVGQTNCGKTTATCRVSVDVVFGHEPWTGRRDGREPRRVLILSKDDTTLSLVRKVRALAPDDAWMDGRLTLIGKEKRPLALDDAGVELLGNTIADGRYDVFVVDPYQHFLPPGLTVNDDEGARHTIDKLDGLCHSLSCSGLLIHHPRKRPPKAKSADDMTKGERLEEIRGSAVLAQLARSVATLWETEPGRRMLDAVVNDVPPLSELWFETSQAGDFGVRWGLAGPPTDAEERVIRDRFDELDPGTYDVSKLARHVFQIPDSKKPSGQRRTQAKSWARRIAEQHPARFRVLAEGGVEVST